MSRAINVTGIDTWELLAALHNATKVMPTTVCTMQARGEITAKEAHEESQSDVRDEYQVRNGVPFWADYLFGRPIKAFLEREGDDVILSRADLYDRDAGQGVAQKVIDGLRTAI